MDDINKSVTKSLQTGQYYIDARRWYLQKYLFPVVERNILIILTIFFLSVIFFVQSYNLISTNQDSDDIKYLVDIHDITDNYAAIKELDTNISPREAIAKYMCENYVTNYESYDYENLQHNINYIYNTSSANLKRSYEFLMSLNNPNSPLVLYQNFGKKNVKIISTSVSNNTCKIFYNVTITSSQTNQALNSQWQANITFKLNNLHQLAKLKKKNLGFKVLDYTTKKLK
jgi:type IV secretion system protein VirB8